MEARRKMVSDLKLDTFNILTYILYLDKKRATTNKKKQIFAFSNPTKNTRKTKLQYATKHLLW